MSDWPSNAPPDFLPLEQRSPEWKAGRLGMATASQFHRIEILKSGPDKGDWSKKAYDYLYELLAERRLKHNNWKRDVSRYASVRYGNENEANGAATFALWKGVSLEDGGFFTRGRVGCSPDRLIGQDELVEIKCPEPPTLVRYLIEGLEEDHKPQIQGQLWITGRQKAHFWAWRHDMPPYHREIERDDIYIKQLSEMVEKFCDRLDEDEVRLLKVWPDGQEIR